MAVAQAQHQVRELAELIERMGGEAGHKNVLLAEANVPYDRKYDMEEINGRVRRRDRDRRQRCRESGREDGSRQPDLRHAFSS